MNRTTALGTQLRAVCDAGLALVYPEVCQLCVTRRATAAEGFVCSQCWQQVRFIKPPFCDRCGLPFEGELTTPFECSNCREMELHFSSARSAVAAGGVILEVIHRYKYHRAVWFEPFLADVFLGQAVAELKGAGWNLIVPVPLHPAREREREFNQAAQMAAWLAEAVGIPVNGRLLKRVLPTRTQTQLSREQRAANMRGAFSMRNSLKLNGEKIVLVDDVFTTGATTSACARVLRAAGAGDVCVWTVARGL